MAQNIKRSICLTPEMLEELQRFAASKNITVAEAIRFLLERGLSLSFFTEEQNTIRQFIREEIENVLAVVMKQYMERLIKMQAVTTRTSGAALFSTISVLSELYVETATSEKILANALRQATQITKAKPKSDEDYLAEAHDWLSAGVDKPNDK